MRIIVFLLFMTVVYTPIYSNELVGEEDNFTKLLSVCSDSTPCLVAESILFAPIFPWFLYPMDDEPTMHSLRAYERGSLEIDFGLMKANDKNSGYQVNVAWYKKWLGFSFDYETYNNMVFDQKYWAIDIILRFSPRRHFQPKFSLGWYYIATDDQVGGGPRLSFFNYDIIFSRRFSMFIINYISWIKRYTIVEGIVGFEYYVYPTISFKTSMDIKHSFSRLIYGGQIGLSVKM